MAQQQARPSISAGQILALAVFFVTAAFLTAMLGTRISAAFDSLQTAAASFSTLCAVVATIAMLIDALDLWVRGRTLNAHTVRLVRMLVFIAVLGALASSFLGENSLVVPIMVPAMVIYLFIARRPPARASSGTTGGGRASSSGSGGGTTARSRQRRGGRKHR